MRKSCLLFVFLDLLCLLLSVSSSQRPLGTHPELDQLGLSLVVLKETTQQWGIIHLSKEALEKIYGIQTSFRWFRGRLEKVELCSVLDAFRRENSVNEYLKKSSLWAKGKESRLKRCVHISQYRGMFDHLGNLNSVHVFAHIQTSEWPCFFPWSLWPYLMLMSSGVIYI